MTTKRLGFIAIALAGCTSIPAEDVVAEVSETMPTVVTVRWTTAQPTVGFVAFGEQSNELTRGTLESEPTTEHEATLVGLPQDSEIWFQIQGDQRSTPLSITTGSLATSFNVTTEGEAQDYWQMMPVLTGDDQIATLFDPQGRVVWAYQDPYPLGVFRAAVSRDGSGIIYSAVLEEGHAAPGSKVVRVSWEGEELASYDVDYLTHDFVELDDGTIVSLAAEFRGEGDDQLEGNKLVAIRPDGTIEDLWSMWDCFDPAVHESIDPNRPGEWSHANALDYNREEDAFILGFRNLASLAHVDRATGTCDWMFGGTASDVAISGPRFRFQHQFDWQRGQLVVFDNQGAADQVSRVLHYAFDDTALTASLVSDVRADPPLFTFVLGDVHLLDNDDLLISWGRRNIVDRMAPDGTRTWRMQLEGDLTLGFSDVFTDPYRRP